MQTHNLTGGVHADKSLDARIRILCRSLGFTHTGNSRFPPNRIACARPAVYE